MNTTKDRARATPGRPGLSLRTKHLLADLAVAALMGVLLAACLVHWASCEGVC